MKRRELFEKGLTLGALACVPAAWGLESAKPPPKQDVPLWLVPVHPWPYFALFLEHPFYRRIRNGRSKMPCCYPDYWRAQECLFHPEQTLLIMQPFFDPHGSRITLILPPLPELSWGLEWGPGGTAAGFRAVVLRRAGRPLPAGPLQREALQGLLWGGATAAGAIGAGCPLVWRPEYEPPKEG